jgi:hypothetical protein
MDVLPKQTAPQVVPLAGVAQSRCVLSLATQDGNFPQRLGRLYESLIDTHLAGELLVWPPGRFPAGCPPHREVPFAFKPYCFDHARQTHDVVLWMDSSCVALRSLDLLFEQISERGYLLFKNNRFKVGQWASDAALAYLGVTRDEALAMDEVNAAVIGLDFRNTVAHAFLDLWLTAARDELAFRGVREQVTTYADYQAVKWNRDERVSADPRVRGHRHDQTVAGVLAYRLNMSLQQGGLQASSRDGPTIIGDQTFILIDRYDLYPSLPRLPWSPQSGGRR